MIITLRIRVKVEDLITRKQHNTDLITDFISHTTHTNLHISTLITAFQSTVFLYQPSLNIYIYNSKFNKKKQNPTKKKFDYMHPHHFALICLRNETENQIRVEKREIPESEIEGNISNCEISPASKAENKSAAVETTITEKIGEELEERKKKWRTELFKRRRRRGY